MLIRRSVSLAKQKIGSFKKNKSMEPPKKKTSIYEEVNGDDEDNLDEFDDLNESFDEYTENEDE